MNNENNNCSRNSDIFYHGWYNQFLCYGWYNLVGHSLLGDKNPITMHSETHGGNEFDAMVFWTRWCIVLLFRGLNLKWLWKMKIFFLFLIIFNKSEEIFFI